MTQFEIHDERWASDLQKGVQQYTDALYEAVYDDVIVETPTLSGEPFDGCDTCFWREALYYLVPAIIRGYQEGKVVLLEDGGTEAKPEA